MATLAAAASVEEAVNKPMVYVDGNGTAYYRASALSSCFNALYAARMGVEGGGWPEWLQQRANAGHDHEPLILAKLEQRFELRTGGYQDEVVMKVPGTNAVTIGHVDAWGYPMEPGQMWVTHVEGKLVGNDKGRGVIDPVLIPFNEPVVVVDAKAFSKVTFEKYLKGGGMAAFPEYQWQQSDYCHGADVKALVLAVKCKDNDCLVVDLYMPPPITKAQIFQKIMKIEAAVKVQQEEGLFTAFKCPDPLDYPCPYFRHHPNDPKANRANKLLDERVAAEMKVIMGHYKEAAAEERAAADKKALFGERIAALVEGREVKTEWGSTYHAGYSAPDWDRLEAEFGIDRKNYTKALKSEKLSIRPSTKAVFTTTEEVPDAA